MLDPAAHDRGTEWIGPVPGELRKAIDDLVDRHLGVPVTSAVPIKSGVNQVLRLEAGGRRLIVRLNEPAELARFEKEAWCIAHASAAGVPGPDVVAIGVEGAFAFMLEADVPGRRGDELSPTEQLSTWRKLGSHLRRINQIPMLGFGEELAGMTTGGEAAWRRYLTYNLEELTHDDPLLETGVLTTQDHERLRHEFEALGQASLHFGLSHGDFSVYNAIVGDDGEPTVIDWGEAHAHVVPHYDLGVILQMSLSDDAPGFAALLAGYGLSRDDYKAIRAEVAALRLLIAADKVRLARARRPDRLAEKTRVLRSLLSTPPRTGS
jgi:aminoglycoside phosphotransferase (APT) family kinase protein